MWLFPKIVGFPPKSSILMGFSIIFTIHFGVPLFLETPMSTGFFLGWTNPNHIGKWFGWFLLKMILGDKGCDIIFSWWCRHWQLQGVGGLRWFFRPMRPGDP